jgi:hypothetical protein
MARPSFLPLQQRRQLRNVGRDPPRLVLRQHLGLQRLGFVRPAVDVGERLAVGIVHDASAGHLFGAPGRWETASHSIFSPVLWHFPVASGGDE